MELNEDGSMKHTTFTKKFNNKDIHSPSPLYGKESYNQYYKRVRKEVDKGFHLGDLSWANWSIYCLGSPHNDEYRQNDIIE